MENTKENVGTPGHVDHNVNQEGSNISQELTPEMIQQLMAMRGSKTKRGITKPKFFKNKRTARKKMASASRRVNR